MSTPRLQRKLTQAHRLAIDHDVCRVIVKDSRNVFSREGIRRVADEQACLCGEVARTVSGAATSVSFQSTHPN